MKSFSTVLAIALSFSATHVLAQDEANAHDGLLPLTTLPLTNEAGSTTVSYRRSSPQFSIPPSREYHRRDGEGRINRSVCLETGDFPRITKEPRI